jgi:hypothetical protein
MRSPRILRVAKGLTAVLAAGVLTGALSQGELECEEAIEHLQGCCETVEVMGLCGGSDCGGRTIPLDQSECIQALGCDELRAAGVCERVTQLARVSGDTSVFGEVCP